MGCFEAWSGGFCIRLTPLWILVKYATGREGLSFEGNLWLVSMI
jgi:hypothetical protein